jgi:anti-anti-sigma factor
VNTWLRMRLHPSQRGPKLTAAGRLDSSNIDTLRHVVAAALRIRGAKVLLLDLSQVTHVDAAGIDALLHCRCLARHADITLQITGVSAQLLAAANACRATSGLGLSALAAPIGCLTGRRTLIVQRTRPARRFCPTRPVLGSRAVRSR